MTEADDEVTLVAPAKLTRSLRITGVRDDGYHLIDAEMIAVDLVDRVVIRPGGDGIEIVPAGSGLPVATGADNSVAQALSLLGRRAGVRLVKRIPAGAGLGGGSSDAAAILRWAGVDDSHVAARLGADVAFCVRGGRARVTGVGEIIEPLDHVEAAFTLCIPPFGCATPQVYAAWDDLGGPTGDGPNDLEAAALRVEPRLVEWRHRFAEATGEVPVLAGSGSTWFVPGAFPGEDRIVVHAMAPFVV